MNLELNIVYLGFKLIEQREMKEINSVGLLFEHEKSGAELFYISNEDDDKVFSIAFKTPPDDDTGLPHILEHSVLCGSKKFPTKEPFTELLKGSLQTFLNAMTSSDMTVYPVASKNAKDFMNLVDVYMDAVLYPKIHEKPEIFMQEGWHYELDDKEGEITYKGVVYNEMRGAFSMPESLLGSNIEKELFPNSQYSNESGGDPDEIVKLKLQQFRDFHNKYYHPSNSKIMFYGNGNITEHLQFINEEYLQDFDKTKVDSDIIIQKPFDEPKSVKLEYPISTTEDDKDKTYLSLAFVIDKSTDSEINFAFDILEDILLETPASPMKKALMDAGIGKDVSGHYENWVLQTYLQINVKNSNPEEKEKFEKIVFETLEKLVKDGIDKKLIEASINSKEFKLREADFWGLSRGLFYNVIILQSWIHDESPYMHLMYEATLDKIKKALTTDYFEKLIQKYLLNNKHYLSAVMTPKKGLQETKNEEIKKKLAEYKNTLKDDEIEKLVNKTKELKEMQLAPDSPENLKKIPLLTLGDVNPEAEKLPLVEHKESDVKVLSHPMFTNKIAYLDLYFDISSVPQEKLPYVALLANFLGLIDTEKFNYSELSNEVNIHTGGISFKPDVMTEKDDQNIIYPKLVVRSKALLDKLPNLVELLIEIIGKSKFDNRKRLREILGESKAGLQMRIMGGFYAEQIRLSSYYSLEGKLREIWGGIEYYQFITDLYENFDNKADEVIRNLNETSRLIFNKNNLLVSFASDEDGYPQLQKNLSALFGCLETAELHPVEYKIETSIENEGLMIPGDVQYVAQGFNFRNIGYKYSGSLRVLNTIVGLDYLWNRVRVRGGAYGARARAARNGKFLLASYRDPNLNETLQVYDELADYVAKFDADEREMTKYILGTISTLDKPLTPSMKGAVAANDYISGLSQDEIQKERDDVLATKPDNIKNFSKMIADVMNKKCFCILGNEGKIQANKDVFKKVISVFK